VEYKNRIHPFHDDFLLSSLSSRPCDASATFLLFFIPSIAVRYFVILPFHISSSHPHVIGSRCWREIILQHVCSC
jgi:hypothetical protein